jgi:hypothetical protein
LAGVNRTTKALPQPLTTFEEADLLDIHLQVMALTDVRELDASKPLAERLDAD